MLFKKYESETQTLITRTDADLKRLPAAHAELEKLKPRWLTLQAKIEDLLTSREAWKLDPSPSVYHPWRNERLATIEAELENKIAERDALTRSLVTEIGDLTERIDMRSSMISIAFCGWAGAQIAKLPEGDPLAVMLEKARAEVRELGEGHGPLGQIVQVITRAVETTEERDENFEFSVFKLGGLARKVGEEEARRVGSQPSAAPVIQR